MIYFLGGEISARNGVTLCRRVQKLGDRRKNCYGNKQQRIKFFVFANKWKEKEEKGTERELSGDELAKSNRRSEVSMLHLESCLLTEFMSSYYALTVFFHWIYSDRAAMKIRLLLLAGAFIGLLV